MKIRKPLTLLFSLLFLAGCNTGMEKPEAGGYVNFRCGVNPDVELTKALPTRTLPKEVIPGTEEISLEISNSEGIVGSYVSMTDYDQPMMEAGEYTAVFSHGNQDAEGNDAACFRAEKTFTVVAQKTSEESVVLTLSNSVYSLNFSEWFRNYYADYSFDIVTESGNPCTYSGTVAEPITETEPYFIPSGVKLYLSGKATKTNGVEVNFPSTEICVSKSGVWQTININAESVSQGTIQITVDDTPVSIKEIPVELNPDA